MLFVTNGSGIREGLEKGKEVGQGIGDSAEQTWQQIVVEFTSLASGYLANAVAAIVVLVVGWVLAVLISALVRGGVRRCKSAPWLTQWLTDDEGRDMADIGKTIGRGTFYLIMIFVLVAFFQTLGLSVVTEPLTAFLNQIFEYAPHLIAATILLFVAWVVASVLRFIVRKVLTTTKIDQHMSHHAGLVAGDGLPLTKTLSEATYWLTFLLFLPALLDALEIPGLLSPVQDMVAPVLGFLPNLLAATIIFLVGWFIARIVRRLTVNLSQTVGANQLSDRVGFTTMIGNNKLSDALGMAVYILILIPVIIGALNALQIRAVTEPASEMLNRILGTLPGIFSACLVVGIAYVVARVVSDLTCNMLMAIGFDGLPKRLGFARNTPQGGRTPSQIAGSVVMVAIVLFAVMQAMPMLGFDLMANMVSQFLYFGARILLGLVIFGFGLYFAKLVSDLVSDSSIQNASSLATVARVAILILAGAMGLQQTGLAQEIVNIAFAVAAGALAVAAAIAFGMGGREAAKTVIDNLMRTKNRSANDSSAYAKINAGDPL